MLFVIVMRVSALFVQLSVTVYSVEISYHNSKLTPSNINPISSDFTLMDPDRNTDYIRMTVESKSGTAVMQLAGTNNVSCLLFCCWFYRFRACYEKMI